MDFAALEEKDWEAFCYVCGEMTAEERHAFELCLAGDDSLCDAVERAVELNAAIGSAAVTAAATAAAGTTRPNVRVASRSIVGRRHAAWGAALAASLLAAVLIGRTAWERRDPGEVAGPAEGTTPSGAPAGNEAGVSLAWSEMRQRGASEVAAGAWGESEWVAESASPQSDMGDPTDALPPQWLLTAVAGANREKETP